jgi:hypothetical protein
LDFDNIDMNYILAQLFLAARKSNEDKGWVQILVFVVLTVFYALGSIVKARANKAAAKGEEKEEENQTSKPARRPSESTIEMQLLKQLFGYPERPAPGKQPRQQVVKPQVQPTRRKVARPAGGAMLEPQVVRPQVQPKLEEIPEFTPAVLLRKSEAAGAEIPQTKYLSEILSDYDDSEKLRRAILHYEILGKPVALREPEGR